MRRLWLASMVLVLAGCTGSTPSGPREVDAEQSLASLRPVAQDVLARWDRAATSDEIVVVQRPGGLRQFGDWEPAVGDNNKAAVLAGLIEPVGALPAGPKRGTVLLAGGRTREVALISADAALERARGLLVRGATAACGDCRPVRITGARPHLMSLASVGGPIDVPAWEFAVDGSAVTLVASAVTDAGVSVLEPFGSSAGNAAAWVQGAGAAEGRAVTVNFTAAPFPADEPCGADYVAEAVESARAVVVLVVTSRANAGNGICPTIGGARTMTVPLRAELGDREVLQATTGLPIGQIG